MNLQSIKHPLSRRNAEIIHKLREVGYKVHIEHYRYMRNEFGKATMNPIFLVHSHARKDFMPNGGKTQVILHRDGEPNLIGEAICSKKENFEYKKGVAIALCRAMANMNKSDIFLLV